MSKKLKKNVPQLRFPEFKGDWQSKTLEELAEWSSGGTPSKEKLDYWNGDIPWISASSMYYDILFDSDQKITELGLENGSRLATKGSILILVRGSILYNRIPMGIAGRDLAFNQDVKCLKIHNKRELFFLFYWLKANENFLKSLVSGTGIGAGKLDTSQLKELILFKPFIEEQEKIASFLRAVDRRLSQLRRKQELLQTYKRGVMQKIFSQEIRFKGAIGSEFPDWEATNLGEIAKIKRGASPRPISSSKWFSVKSNIGWVRISDVTKSDKYLDKTEQYLSASGIEKSKFVSSENLIMSICATIGKPIINKIDVCIHDGFVVFENLKTDILFTYFFLKRIESGWKKYGQPGIQLNLNTDIVSNESIYLPSLEEQKK
ncbi:MAG: restriction endonuclease subunit S [Nostoc sp. LLA-1]|nr:restriction endonuclease subunit S [Cyanocohniella sp. LLY]